MLSDMRGPCAPSLLPQSWSMTESDSDFEMLESRLSQLTPDERILVGAACGRAERRVCRAGAAPLLRPLPRPAASF